MNLPLHLLATAQSIFVTINLSDFVASLLYSFVGIVIFCLTFVVVDRIITALRI